MKRRAFVGLAGVVILGCAVATVANLQTVTVAVDNDYLDDAVTVYVQNRAGFKLRLGELAPGQDARFEMPEYFLGRRVAFVVVPHGKRNTRVYTDSDMTPVYGTFAYAVTDIPFPVGTSEVRLHLAPRLDQSKVRGWR